ncbi:MAG: hypothetical protein FWE52_02650 [Alphaproteobacteria bacterium]|nr:hypothetical protein [Alphaproteobacteria bacterium]
MKTLNRIIGTTILGLIVSAPVLHADEAAPVVPGRAAVASVAAAQTAAAVQPAIIQRGAASSSIVRGASEPMPARAGVSRATVGAQQTAMEREEMRAAFNENEKGIANESAAVRRAGVTLRPSVAEVGGRATIPGTAGAMTGSNINNTERVARSAAARPTSASVAETTERLGALNALTEACRQQYMDCMDQFCNVIDANQKRCSCSARLNTYTRSERAVRDANNQLNDVAQRIRYVGLSADEIRAIMTATEAELALAGQTDTTENRQMLESIEKLIRSPETFVNEANTGNALMDLDLDFTNTDSLEEMFSLEMFGGGGSFSNMRGTQLHNAAKARCRNVLNTCTAQGVNAQAITARYDMEIDKDCIAFEQGLGRMNDTLRNNVRAATQMLQKARLAVLQNQNQFDAKGCLGALEQCMSDDMVCGNDYIKCLDPSKRFIDENGEIVLGQNINNIRRTMMCFDNSKVGEIIAGNNAAGTCPTGISLSTATNGFEIVRFLQSKIGMGESPTSGMCRVVLDKCRQFSYSAGGKYNPHNDIVVNYIQRAMVNIKAGQERAISRFATTCMQDIAHCYSQQVSQVNAWSSAASVTSIHNVMRGACRNVALTCAYAVFSADNASCPTTTTNNVISSSTAQQETCIENISSLFYQSMLCTDPNSEYINTANWTPVPSAGSILTNPNVTTPPLAAALLNRVFVNEKCLCNIGYGFLNGRCVLPPPNANLDPTCTSPMPGAVVDGTPPVGNIGCPMIGIRCMPGHTARTDNGTCHTTPTS